ncbi:Altered inheritance of mitochondria protein 9, mitochondrial [Madurella mycetomatis]|uniref:Altered inheritance of mitochondria protein 9, mitochondrial n=1 Tax=Madurella mycetomatis TaxID=100816 RepID=A0A175VYX6_9PEZI|nr:Altered inheritance of mitochondria protein 9, mitochondrial [Madurella mycetomatis]KXX82081.1 Altered inheritance of mitochondria protein 9, mitochondrial [Madurella mycetomatis]
MRDTSREGLAWDDNGLGPEPQWTREPEIQAVTRVCRRHLGVANHGSDGDFAVSFLADGAFNKLYHVKTARGQFVMRVSLPVDPRNKTRGEAATLQLVHRKTDIPVPAVVAFDDSRASEIGFEWLLMDMIPGTPVYYRWRKMSMAQKETLTARVADFQAQLLRCGNFGNGFRSIGTLGARSELDRAGLPEPGQIVSAFFFSGERWHYAVPRGPFQSSHDWLRAHLNIIIKEHTTALTGAKSDDDKEYAQSALRVARKLLRILHKVFPAIVNPPERTVLWHDELSLRNILVDGNGGITGIIGWECVSTMPRWVASQVPEFLRGAAREIKPDRNCYTDVDKGVDVEGELEDGLDSEGKTELYWIHLMEYEQTQLRKVYAARMRQLRLGWDVEVEEGALKVDFLGAVLRCGAGFYLRRIEQWVDAVERKEFLPLMEVLRVGIKKDKTSKPPSSGSLTLTSRLS